MDNLDENFWDTKWKNHETGWDIGHASPAIVSFFENHQNKNVKILIPGCGNAHEAEALSQLGFTNISVLDIAPTAVENLKYKFQNNRNIQVLHGNFFEHQEQYDILVEQTFFCAISPALRVEYVEKAHSILSENGKIVGVMFQIEFEKQGPPFGGNREEYKNLFQNKFEIKTLENCYNSIEPRKDKEVFVHFIKK